MSRPEQPQHTRRRHVLTIQICTHTGCALDTASRTPLVPKQSRGDHGLATRNRHKMGAALGTWEPNAAPSQPL